MKKKKHLLHEIGLCAQNIDFILGSIQLYILETFNNDCICAETVDFKLFQKSHVQWTVWG